MEGGDQDLVIGWHASRSLITKFEPFLHVGSEAQARMRGHVGDTLHQLRFPCGGFIRLIDRGSWSTRDLLALQANGHQGVVYLNRFEGILQEELHAAITQKLDLDSMSDAAFRRTFPSAADSWIVFDPSQVEILSTTKLESRRQAKGSPAAQ